MQLFPMDLARIQQVTMLIDLLRTRFLLEAQ